MIQKHICRNCTQEFLSDKVLCESHYVYCDSCLNLLSDGFYHSQIKTKMTAIEFYKLIRKTKQQQKYKLINQSFIVKYIDDDGISMFIGYFHKPQSALNKTNTARVEIVQDNPNLLYCASKGYSKTGLGMWKKLNINWTEENLREIL